MSSYDATIVGAGPNGLTAAVELARHGMRPLVLERNPTIGGSARTAELTLPGFRHDVCAAIHPTGIASPAFNDIGLDVDWITPDVSFSHPLGGGRVAASYRSVGETAHGLGPDAATYRRVMEPLVEAMETLLQDVLGPMGVIPEDKSAFARVAALGGLPASLLAHMFKTTEARALIAGLAGHAIAPFHALATAGVGLLLGALGHSHGWPMARGGTQAVVDALAARVVESGGVIETGVEVTSSSQVEGDLLMLDVMPPDALRIAARSMTDRARRRLSRWAPGPGVFKVDWALDGPIPWDDPVSGQTATVHVGGTYEQIAAAEASVFRGDHPEHPFVLLAQHTLFDPTRAPDGQHTAWGYCHVPNGSGVDMTERIERQIERFAPGFRDRIIGRAVKGTSEYESYNPNLIGGDIGGGRYRLGKVLQMGSKRPYSLGGGAYLCSSAVPPGAGVHGMAGFHAARAALDNRGA